MWPVFATWQLKMKIRITAAQSNAHSLRTEFHCTQLVDSHMNSKIIPDCYIGSFFPCSAAILLITDYVLLRNTQINTKKSKKNAFPKASNRENMKDSEREVKLYENEANKKCQNGKGGVIF